MTWKWMLLALVACGNGGEDTCDTDADTDCDAGGGGGGDTDTTPGSAPLEATIVASNGDTVDFRSSSVFGEYNTTEFGFTAMGSDPTNNLAIGITGGSGLGTYTIEDGGSASPASYTDFTWGLQNGGFVSVTGSIEITGWEPYGGVGSGHAATGTYTIEMTNSPDAGNPAPEPITLQVSGSFTEIELIEGT